MTHPSKELPVLLFGDQQSFAQWLENHHDTSPGIWLQIAKKNAGVVSVSYGEALEAALCYGWVDSHKEKFDERTWIQRFTPRKANSIWSKVNKDKAEVLIAQGRMKPAGFDAIEAAKKNGQWEKAYESQSIAAIPEDFANALARNVKAKAFYDTLKSQNRYAFLFRIHNAKKPETRAKRIHQYVEMLEKGEILK